mmetsp:Transcript_30296/g.97816  ORF Transcript_30296/g.97816 Transcript_30296/m.97816 type:complete len:323 (+) Transcript_30296:724-1692(+)|eukprot:scaffold11797_cov123-Isochrysis_galbana.AAC.12
MSAKTRRFQLLVSPPLENLSSHPSPYTRSSCGFSRATGPPRDRGAARGWVEGSTPRDAARCCASADTCAIAARVAAPDAEGLRGTRCKARAGLLGDAAGPVLPSTTRLAPAVPSLASRTGASGEWASGAWRLVWKTVAVLFTVAGVGGPVALPESDEPIRLSVSPASPRLLSQLPTKRSVSSRLGSQEGCSSPTEIAPGAWGFGLCVCISPVAASDSRFFSWHASSAAASTPLRLRSCASFCLRAAACCAHTARSRASSSSEDNTSASSRLEEDKGGRQPHTCTPPGFSAASRAGGGAGLYGAEPAGALVLLTPVDGDRLPI